MCATSTKGVENLLRSVLANSRGAYALVHAFIGHAPAQGHWRVALWDRNLTAK